MKQQADLLLLNCSNLPWRPIYPYAFVQVSEVAKRFGLNVRRFDMLEINPKLWAPMLRRIIDESQPRMIGIHLRQGDTLCHSDYDYVTRQTLTPPNIWSYFPVADTRKLIETLRGLTRAPITMGGFGFTANARRLMDFLEPEYGVQGCPDGFFARFEDVIAGRDLDTIPGLAHRKPAGYAYNERGYYDPAIGSEYTEEIIEELARFYGHSHLYGPSAPTIAVEVMRGCPFRCYFCAEPDVKGRRAAYRDLDVIEEEVRRLRRRQMWRFWFVCSELNIKGSDFAMQLAERILRLNEEFPEQPIEWTGYSLPTMSPSDLRVLQRAGYVGALNDVLSLDDENLKASGVPYRSRHAIGYLRGLLGSSAKKTSEEELYRSQPPVEDARSWYAAQTAKPHTGIFSLFLGNAHADEKTIYRSLQRVDEEGLNEYYDDGTVLPATRILDIKGMEALLSDESLVSFDRTGARPADLIWPTFLYPQFLVKRLGSVNSVMELFGFIADTFLSVGHRRKKDWGWFLSNRTTIPGLKRFAEHALQQDGAIAIHAAAPAEVRAIVERATRGELSQESYLRTLFSPPAGGKEAWNHAARILLEHIWKASSERTSRVLTSLGLPAHEGTRVPLSEYKIMRLLYARYGSLPQLRAEVLAQMGVKEDSLEALFLEYLLYTHNVVLRSEYREILFGPDAGAEAPDSAAETT